MWGPIGVVVYQRDRAGCVTAQGHGLQGDVAESDSVSMNEGVVSSDGNAVHVEGASVGGRSCRRDDIRQRTPVVLMPMRRDDTAESRRSDQRENPVGFSRGINQKLHVRSPTAEQVGVVAHGTDGHLADDQCTQLVNVGGTAYADPAGVHDGRVAIGEQQGE